MRFWHWVEAMGSGAPCLEDCEHGNCQSARAIVATLCLRCGLQIGYNEHMVFERADETSLRVSHRRCWEART
jgi:hypothetical protein